MIQGGRGTFNTILTTWSNHTPCVLVRESRGCARAFADFALKVQEHPERDPGSVERWASLLHEQLEQWDVKVPREKVEEVVRLLLPSLSKTPPILDKRTMRDLMIVFSMAKAESLETSILNAVVASCKLRTDADIERRKQARRAVKVPQPVGSLEQPAKPPVHLKARDPDRYVGADCPEGVRRLPIPDESLVPWEVDWTATTEGGYHPPTYEHPVLTMNCNHGATREDRRAHASTKWADPPAPLSSDLIAEVLSRKTYEMRGVLLWDHEKRLPLNPRGRTGLAGRGLLGKWGPNHAADPIVTRLHPTTNQLQMVAIERADQPGVWALPGGMVDEGETVSETVQREFRAEVGNILDPEGQRRFEEATGKLFASGGTVVYRGYVDDPRTTDHAWIETTAFHFHCPPEIGDKLALGAGDDAKRAIWLDINPMSEDRYANLYASHRQLVDRVAEKIAPHERARVSQAHNKYPSRVDVPDENVPWSVPFPGYAPTDYTDTTVTANFRSPTRQRWADPEDPRQRHVSMETLIHEVSSTVVSPRGSAKRLLDPRSAETVSLTSYWIERRLTFEGPLQFEEGNASLAPNGGRGRPLNPRGRTGLAGRGLLGKWGPNHAADPIVTRLHPTTNQLQVVVVKRTDGSDEWSLPGALIATDDLPCMQVLTTARAMADRCQVG